MRRRVPFLVLAALAAAAGAALAHSRSLSYSKWELGAAGARVELMIPLLELTRFAEAPSEAYFAASLRLFAGEEACESELPQRLEATPDGMAVYRWSVTCRSAGPRSIRSEILSGAVSSHVHFARVSIGEGEVRERVLVETDPVWKLEEPSSAAGGSVLRGATLASYVRLGVEHILAGSDHLAFLAALLLLAASIGEVATLVTGFTVAHSLTLGLAVVGALRPEPAAVEMLIGFSIALVAAENVWLLGEKDGMIPASCVVALAAATAAALLGHGVLPWIAWVGLAVFSACHFGLLAAAERPARVRAAIAFAFGLIHGFGFAGVLMEIDLPTARLVPALFGFNAGVELGQLGIVAVSWPLLFVLGRRSEHWRRRLAELGSGAVFALGLFWLITRAWG